MVFAMRWANPRRRQPLRITEDTFGVLHPPRSGLRRRTIYTFDEGCGGESG